MTTYRKTKQIILKGGFHKAKPIKVTVSKDFDLSLEHHVSIVRLIDELSEKTLKKLENHFCGVKGCKCGGIIFATILESTLN